VAALVIQHRGAILPRQLTPQLRAACGIEPPP
jgi:hypothetical protein